MNQLFFDGGRVGWKTFLAKNSFLGVRSCKKFFRFAPCVSFPWLLLHEFFVTFPTADSRALKKMTVHPLMTIILFILVCSHDKRAVINASVMSKASQLSFVSWSRCNNHVAASLRLVIS